MEETTQAPEVTATPAAPAEAPSLSREAPFRDPDAPAEAPKAETKPEAEDKPAEGEEAPKEEKPAKSEAEKEKARLLRAMQRRSEALGRRDAENAALRARLQELEQRAGLTRQPIDGDNRADGGDSDLLSLPRSEAQRLIEERARQLAPQIAQQLTEREQLTAAASKAKASLGEDFADVTDELASVFQQDRQLMLLRAENPAEVMRHLADPDNAALAEQMARMDSFDFTRALVKLDGEMSAAKAKPQRSNAPTPLEPIRGRGDIENGMPNPANTKAWLEWQNKQEAAARKSGKRF